MDDGFLTNLILQRTAPFIALGGKDALREWTRTGAREQLLAVLSTPELRTQYTKAAFDEIREDVMEYLALIGDARPLRIVSIGAGNGIAEAMLASQLRPESMLLIDVETGAHGHGFSEEAAGYSNLSQAVMIMRESKINCELLTWNPKTQPQPAYPFDLCISMLAMGFHFRADAYDGFITANACPGAMVIYDARGLRGWRSRTIARKPA